MGPINNDWVTPYVAPTKHWRDIAKTADDYRFARVDFARRAPPVVRNLHYRFPMCCVVDLTVEAKLYVARHRHCPREMLRLGERAVAVGLVGGDWRTFPGGAVFVLPLGRHPYKFAQDGELEAQDCWAFPMPPELLTPVGYRYGFDREAVTFFEDLARAMDEEPDTEVPLTKRSAELASGWRRTG